MMYAMSLRRHDVGIDDVDGNSARRVASNVSLSVEMFQVAQPR
jgi:hypothetical protein